MGFFQNLPGFNMTAPHYCDQYRMSPAACIKRLPTEADLREFKAKTVAMSSTSPMSVSSLLQVLSKSLLTLRESVVLTNTHSPYHRSQGISPQQASSTSARWLWAPKKMATRDHALEMNNLPGCFPGHIFFGAMPEGQQEWKSASDLQGEHLDSKHMDR